MHVMFFIKLIIIAIFHTHGGRRLKEYNSIFLKAIIFQVILIAIFYLALYTYIIFDLCFGSLRNSHSLLNVIFSFQLAVTYPRQLEKHAKRQSGNMNKKCIYNSHVEHTVKRNEKT